MLPYVISNILAEKRNGISRPEAVLQSKEQLWPKARKAGAQKRSDAKSEDFLYLYKPEGATAYLLQFELQNGFDLPVEVARASVALVEVAEKGEVEVEVSVAVDVDEGSSVSVFSSLGQPASLSREFMRGLEQMKPSLLSSRSALAPDLELALHRLASSPAKGRKVCFVDQAVEFLSSSWELRV
ncbi:hypothetical protein Acr_00g0104590 [Actinidia rufa]|uniref:Uncharacterized protein n=1 Tax=Actinidia rufa TaxID=165716 RepID=A0A7J0E0Y8_9ERIC|nr:hypothetical protein Acr_00g0104590 [Actinidia rufa]